jgi:hypothetical protein
LNTAAWDIQDHNSGLAGYLGVPPGRGVVEGNEIPYKPDALEQRKKNFEQRDTEDPAFAKCLLPGVPRATYMPYPFEIIQNPKMVGIRYAFARAVRTIDLAGRSRQWLEGWPDFWMGDSRGKWEGDTLVVDVRKLDERTWFDHAGNFHSELLHVVERYSPIDPRSHPVRSDHRGPERVHAAVEDQPAALSHPRPRTPKSSSGIAASIRTARNTRTPFRNERARGDVGRVFRPAPTTAASPLATRARRTSPHQSAR